MFFSICWPLRSIPKEFMLSPLGHPDKSWPQVFCAQTFKGYGDDYCGPWPMAFLESKKHRMTCWIAEGEILFKCIPIPKMDRWYTF